MKKLFAVIFLVFSVFGRIVNAPIFSDVTGNPFSGETNGEIRVYEISAGGEPIWTGRAGPELPMLYFINGTPVNIEELLPTMYRVRDEIWVELTAEGVMNTDQRIRLSGVGVRNSVLYRDTPVPGETAETLDDDLILGVAGDELYVDSDRTGFGDSAPNERVTVAGAVSMQKATVPPTSTAGYGKVYVDDGSGHLMYLDDAGTPTDLLATSEGGIPSVSSSANIAGRTEHMRFIPGEATEITESATDDTIYIRYDHSFSSTPCSTAPPQPSPIDGITPVCSGEPGTSYGVAPSAEANYYRWTLPTGSSVVSGFGTNIIHAYLGDFDGNICVKAVNECGESPERCFAVTINRPTSPGPITGASLVCSDTTGLPYYIDAVPEATNYIWTLPPGATIASGSGTPSIVVNFGSEDGEVCVRTENSCGRSEPECLAVTITETPGIPGTISGPTSVCESASGTYTIASVPEATNYAWTVPSGATIASGSGSAAIDVDFGTTSGSVCVEAQSICGTSPQRCLAVTVLYAPVITSQPTNQTVDEGDPATFSVTATGAGTLSYAWEQSTNSGTSWAAVGTDSPSYNTGATIESMTGYQYRVTVIGTCSPPVVSNVATLTVETGLYDFTSHTFTNCSVAGRLGPTLSQCRSAYSTTWDENAAFFNMTAQGIQEWTVPRDGTYRIECWGAASVPQTYTSSYSGRYGRGARMRGDFVLTQGQKLFILVGQSPIQSQFNGGGGGTFVATGSSYSTATALIIAGGGASYRVGYDYSGDWQTMLDASTTTSGKNSYGTGGTGGSGGNTSSPDGPGAGFIGNANGGSGTRASSFRNGGAGGAYSSSGNQDGGFGGGGHGGWGGAGGGGGYSGGGGPYNNIFPPGGGGGSYNSGSNQSNSSPVNTGHGYVTIQML